MTGGCCEEQQEIGNAIGAALFDERALQRERLVVRDQPEPADFELTRCRTPR